MELLREECPEGVQPFEKEMHLSPQDFMDTFGVDWLTWTDYPKWKKDQMKQDSGLY